MFYSAKYNLLYVASPKSGSVSVEKILSEVDPQGEKHTITIGEHKITSNDMYYGVMGHARAWEIIEAMGQKKYNSLQTVGFVRHPFEKLVSSYFYNRKQSLIKSFRIKGKKHWYFRVFKTFMTRFIAKVLPISVWALIFPMKTSYEYFHDKEGNRIVKYLGRTDHLDEDLLLILDKLGIDNDGNVPHENKSKHSEWSSYFQIPILINFLTKKYENDVQLYREVEDEQHKLRELMNYD